MLSQGSFKYSGKPIRIGHARLFDKGLNETHFDMVAGHLVSSLKELGIPEDIVQDIVQVVVPLRQIFESEAQDRIRRSENKKKKI